MQAVLDYPPNILISEADAHARATAYVVNYLGPSFGLGKGSQYYHKALGKTVWQFILRIERTPLHALYIDAQTGKIIPLTDDELRKINERAAIAVAEVEKKLPVDAHGYILAEYARRKTNGYLSREVSLFCGATDGLLIPLDPAIWQFAIRFKLPEHGELGILGTIEIDARSGEMIPLPPQQIEQMKARVNAIVEFQTQSATI